MPLLFRLALLLLLAMPFTASAQPQTPEQFFGFPIGADGELARYPRVLEYLRHLEETTGRLRYEQLGTTTLGHPYVLATISAPANLARLDRLVEITRRLADPRRVSDAEARALAREGRPFYLLYATIHSTEVGNGQAIVEIAHRLATGDSAEVREILDNLVLLLVPSQNPDGQILVVDHWYRTRGTPLARVYPDLYQKYTGHDNNRDWFMFTQKETRLAVEKVQNAYKPQITHDMHQQHPDGARMFVPPFADPYDPNIHPIVAQAQAQVGLAMAAALVAEGKGGVVFNEAYDMWTPARQYMVYRGQPRILTEIASANLADPYVNPAGADRPLGPQERRWNFPLPYDRPDWRLRQIVDYGVTVVFAGLAHVAKHREQWLRNFHRVHADWTRRTGPPHAFVVPAAQRDPLALRELLDILQTGEVELHRARAPFTAGGRPYAAGSWVIEVAQPYGAFAKTLLETQVHPDLRLVPGGPPKPPYDVTGHTLGLLLGVDVDQVDAPFEADLARADPAPEAGPMPRRPRWAYLVGPESNAGFHAVAGLQAAGVPVYRAGRTFDSGGRRFAPGTWIVPAADAARAVLADVASRTGLEVFGADRPVAVDGTRLKPATRIGLWKGANNMPGGWLLWVFEQYGFNHRVVSAHDFEGDLAARYDVIVLPAGTTRNAIVRGLDPARYDAEWSWAYGVGEQGWARLREWVHAGGTLLAIGSAADTARELLDLPIEPALPDSSRRRPGGADGPPAFYCPGSLLQNVFDPAHPVAFGMPDAWPVFFRFDRAWRIAADSTMAADVVASYPTEGPLLRSGWLLGEDLLRGQANVVALRAARGFVVVYGSQVDFRAQPRATFKLLFNAIFHGPAAAVDARRLARLEAVTD